MVWGDFVLGESNFYAEIGKFVLKYGIWEIINVNREKVNSFCKTRLKNFRPY